MYPFVTSLSFSSGGLSLYSRLPGNRTATQFVETWVHEVFAPAVKELDGLDGQVNVNELSDNPSLKGVVALALTEALHMLETQRQSRVEVQELVDAAHH